MTAREVQNYLDRGGDTMFIAMGVVECHGDLPIDCETIIPEAYCKLLAEKADGLAMINLPYFYPGGTIISNATVYVGVRDSIRYLNLICHSLVDQGFKRLFFISGHAPAPVALNVFARDFFEETLIHPCNLMEMAFKAGATFGKDNCIPYGAYKVMNQMEYLPVDPEGGETETVRMESDPSMERFSKLYGALGGYTSKVYSDPNQHSGGKIFKSEEEKLEYCTKGEEQLRQVVDECKIVELKEALGNYQEYVQRMYVKFPRIKTKDRTIPIP